MKHSIRGITLFETLVVCVIVAIVSSILMSVFGSAKASASKTVSVSNMQQIHKAMLMYRDDWNDYPCAFSAQDPKTGKITAPQHDYFVAAYLGGTRLSAPEIDNPATWEGQTFPGYLMRGGFNDDHKLRPHLISQACREKRGGLDPLVYDMNVGSAKIAQAHGDRYWLLIREQGNVQKLPLKYVLHFQFLRDTWPCPQGTRLDNL